MVVGTELELTATAFGEEFLGHYFAQALLYRMRSPYVMIVVLAIKLLYENGIKYQIRITSSPRVAVTRHFR